ncbi:ABC transporter substrate-binding protein [Actinomadura rudentiformis]|uniref:ABC transporter substrate-binding protein n=1 Tax=Actinomadura rudentiformis TaxID=359158 RepID=A0A6H9YD69_9ACTN|nr:ABC transporter substrate-binding protein [Actinomadura rudentiformis]KAB2341537.1 ABC transporter substrate-binding protein [Actinomadura rudentiformis]
MRQSGTAKAGGVVLALALVASGCGSNRSGSAETGGDGRSPAASAATFGDLPSPCGPGAAKGATDQGVTAGSIKIGYGDDRGFAAAPGLSEEVGDAIDSMIKWCNQQGGILGRKLVGTRYDAALTNAAAVMKKACASDFMLVGEGFAYDEAAEPVRVGCDLPAVPAFTIGPNANMGPDKYEPMPFPVDRYNASGLAALLKVVPGFGKNPAMVLSDSPPIKAASAKVTVALGKLGVKVKDCGITISQNGESNYVPFAQKFKDCGASALWTSNGPIPSQMGMFEALGRIGSKPPKVAEAQWYSQVAAQWNGKSHAVDGLVTSLSFQPFENADKVTAVKQYLDLVRADKGKPALLGMSATSAFLLWATAAKKCGDDLTRKCMVSGLSTVHQWTGGGLHAPSDPGGNLPSNCSLVVRLDGGTWKQVYPEKASEFSCDKSKVFELDPKLSGVTLNNDRLSTAFLKK